MGKVGKKDGDFKFFRFLLDEKVLLSSYNNYIDLCYRIDDWHFFLSFSTETKKFEEMRGFGRDDKTSVPDWWKDPIWHWKEMSEEDENQST